LARLGARFSKFSGRHPLVVRRARLFSLVVLLLVGGRFAFDTILQWGVVAAQPLNLDFSLYRASAILGMQHGWNHLYDLAAQRQVYEDQLRANPSLGPMLWAPNVYTPVVSWLALPFTFLPIPLGYFIWSALIFAATAIAGLVLAPGSRLAKVAQVTLMLIPLITALSLEEGQVTSFQIAGIAACWLLMRRGHDSWAGIALVPFALKPQTMSLVPFALLIAGRYRVFASWLVASSAIGVAVLAVIGFDGTLAYIQRLQYASAHLDEFLLGPWYNLPLHFNTSRGRLGAGVLAGSLALLVAWRHRRLGPEIPIAAGLIGSLLVTSYVHLNDLLTLFPAGWLILRAKLRWWLWILIIGGYVTAAESTATGIERWGEGLLLFELAVLGVLAVITPTRPSRPWWVPVDGERVTTQSEHMPLALVGVSPQAD
jgi:hypothetical protein